MVYKVAFADDSYDGLYCYMTFRLLFYAVCGGFGIFKVNYNGQESTQVVEVSLGFYFGLDFDAEGRICWADYGKYQLLASIKVGSY